MAQWFYLYPGPQSSARPATKVMTRYTPTSASGLQDT